MSATPKHLASVALAGVGLAAFAGPASAEERVCRGTIGQTTVDNVRVPQGALCTLNRTYAKGTVKVERGATLRAYAVRVVGNVQGEGHRSITVSRGSRVNGSLQAKQGGGALVEDSVFGSDVQFFSNSGTITIRRNRINGNLQCKSNTPAPVGHSNVVGGNKEDQCRRL